MPKLRTKQQKLDDDARMARLNDEFLDTAQKIINDVKRSPNYKRLETLISTMYPDGTRIGPDDVPMIGVKPTVIIGYQGSMEETSKVEEKEPEVVKHETVERKWVKVKPKPKARKPVEKTSKK